MKEGEEFRRYSDAANPEFRSVLETPPKFRRYGSSKVFKQEKPINYLDKIKEEKAFLTELFPPFDHIPEDVTKCNYD